ncbi:tRNA (adenine-N1)-methyltransferase [Methanobacterium congolense]|uniref:tRNA (Adenine(57)-N(1)/adenine(58)-N(1))-methyltransferase TrmI n=1 Tax=Methanobacterium congolense TaxID=118062 RepID=A0A1D3L5U8_9EURY|nr:tRNA (adenine-N1)-methyltransferase [Methanobacterium congolense]SCG86860.1 tRNA (adenine(57)-N(1)/adenine(58)-N(1))-methyltransferase TrmI [Methanobacterium congolense]
MRILVDERDKKYMVEDKEFHSDFGVIKAEDISSSKAGDVLKTHLGKEFKVMEPNINDYIDLMERKCSIILQKDIGMVVAFTGLGNGCKVVDAGTGAGATAMHFANVVGPEGSVVSYEVREDFAEIAKRNVEGFGLKNLEVKCGDITEGIAEDTLDLVFLDLPKPWEVADHAMESLRSGGYVAAYTPYMEQFQTFSRILKKVGFSEVKVLECIVREIEVKAKGTRPKTRMAGHTGYLTFGRKL